MEDAQQEEFKHFAMALEFLILTAARWGEVPFYGWSEDKARQYGVPQRADFGAFVRKKGFCLD